MKVIQIWIVCLDGEVRVSGGEWRGTEDVLLFCASPQSKSQFQSSLVALDKIGDRRSTQFKRQENHNSQIGNQTINPRQPRSI